MRVSEGPSPGEHDLSVEGSRSGARYLGAEGSSSRSREATVAADSWSQESIAPARRTRSGSGMRTRSSSISANASSASSTFREPFRSAE